MVEFPSLTPRTAPQAVRDHIGDLGDMIKGTYDADKIDGSQIGNRTA